MKPQAPPTPGLLFHWEKRRGFNWLPGFLLLSVLAHGASFFLFTIVYPEQVILTPPPPSITCLDHDNPDHKALLAWIDARDPARIASPVPLHPSVLFQARYHASYLSEHTSPRTALHSPTPPPLAPVAPTDAIDELRPRNPPSSPTTAGEPTRVAFSDSLAARTPNSPPALNIPYAGPPLKPARILLGITQRGEVRFTYIQESSGNTEADHAAMDALTPIAFAPGATEITWGFATVHWGESLRAPAPAQPSNSSAPTP